MHEHQGLGLISVGGTLRAIDTASNGIQWSEEDLTRPEAVTPGSSAAFIPMIGSGHGNIISLTWETLDGDEIVAAHDFFTGEYPEDGMLWQTEMVGDVGLGAATNAAVTSDGDGVALSWEDGDKIARGDLAVPSIVDSADRAYVPTGAPFEYAIAAP